MYTIDHFAKDMHADAMMIRNDLFAIATKCLQWGVQGIEHLDLKEAKVVGKTLFLRFVASNHYLAIDVVKKKVYEANYDLKEIPGEQVIDLYTIANITKELRQRYSKTSPVSF